MGGNDVGTDMLWVLFINQMVLVHSQDILVYLCFNNQVYIEDLHSGGDVNCRHYFPYICNCEKKEKWVFM